MATTQPIRNKNHILELTQYFLRRNEYRNFALVMLGLHTALRISDILSLRWDNVYDFAHKKVLESIDVVEGKTKKPKTIALHDNAVAALSIYAAEVPQGCYLFENPRTKLPISRIQAYRIISNAAKELGLHTKVSCHSLRKTFGYFAWKSGVSPAVIMEIYNHSSLAVTRRYLGVTQDDKNTVYLNLDMSA